MRNITPEQQALLDTMHNLDVAPPKRAKAGRELAKPGDPRSGVGLQITGIPDIKWKVIYAGDSLISEETPEKLKTGVLPQLTHVDLPNFYMAAYPVTYTQYEVFVNQGGYENRSYWTESGWRWKGEKHAPAKAWDDDRFHIGNHPVVGITWHEALAFTRWLNTTARNHPEILPLPGYEVRLPTHAEWEKGARGTDGRLFPWGDKYRCGFANINEVDGHCGKYNLGHTTAVGIYPHSRSPYSLHDMSGNVWEWGVYTWKAAYFSLDDGDSLEPHYPVMGGSWRYDEQYAHAGSYYEFKPNYRDIDVGFRLCAQSLPGAAQPE